MINIIIVLIFLYIKTRIPISGEYVSHVHLPPGEYRMPPSKINKYVYEI